MRYLTQLSLCYCLLAFAGFLSPLVSFGKAYLEPSYLPVSQSISRDVSCFYKSDGFVNNFPAGFGKMSAAEPYSPLLDTSIISLDPPQLCFGIGQVRLQAGFASQYKWLRNNIPITGAFSQLYIATQEGHYRVVVSDASGLTDTSRVIHVTLNPQPIVSFSVNRNNQCLPGNYFVFNNTSTITAGAMSYRWHFGDGTMASSATAANSYQASGTYFVSLVATSDLGCRDSVTQAVVVTESPVASFNILSAAQQCLSGNSFQFVSTSTISSGPLTAQWSFGDGTVANVSPATHLYQTSGTFPVKLRVGSNAGCLDSVTQLVVVHPKPQVSFLVNSSIQCLAGNLFQFTNTSAIQSGYMTYSWSFGNSVGSQSTNTNYSFSAAGSYPIKLVATSNFGCVDSSSQIVQVSPTPSASFSVNSDAQCLTGNQFVFTNNSTVQSGTLLHSWNFGNGIGNSNLASPTYSYQNAGSYLVTLDVSTTQNCTARLSRTIIVRPSPVGDLNSPSNTAICEGGIITLTAFGGDSYQWFWNGGLVNGATSATYTASQPGTYTVRLINVFGCSTSGINAVTLSLVSKPLIDFSFDSYCQDKSVQFTDLTSTAGTGPVTRLWNFGDGNTSTLTNPQHRYNAPGTYNVSLRVTPTGCSTLSNTATKPIAILASPINTRYPILNAVSGQNQPLVARPFANAAYSWAPASFLSNSAIRNPVFNGTADQTYLIRIITPSGCEVVDTQQVRVFADRNVYLPDVFSPNGDGKNDRLTPILVGVPQLRFFRVYDRWGQLVFQTARVGEGWDGWFRGLKQPMETYTWVIEGVDQVGTLIRKTGTSVLIR